LKAKNKAKDKEKWQEFWDEVFEELEKLEGLENLKSLKNSNKNVRELYEKFFQKLSEDLDKLLFFKDVLEKVLIYARYHAKAKDKTKNGGE
ncbi:MAG TPA: hypothetical protein DER56_03095, partial [Thermosipho africanus]|nr:hypothetical protein [Thermosipho africanus]